MPIPLPTLTIRSEAIPDHSAIRHIHTLAFGQPDEADLVDRIRQSNGYRPELSLVALVNARPVGHVLLSPALLTAADQEKTPVLTLAPIAVLPEFQAQGIGGALIELGLAIADKTGEPLVTVLGHPRYYTRFGFIPAVPLGIQHPFPVPEEAFMIKPLTAYTPALTGKLCYSPAFEESGARSQEPGARRRERGGGSGEAS